MNKNKPLLTICLNANHWNLFDSTCIKCKSEVKESCLLNDEEYADWLDGKFSIGFNLKIEQIPIHLKSRRVEDDKMSGVVVSEML